VTVSTGENGSGGALALPADMDFGSIGMEDVSASDIAIPRLQIVHAEGKFKDTLSGATYDSGFPVILLGLVKQRVFWAEETDDGDMPLCKSPDFDHGFPNMDPEVGVSKQFPWKKSNFDPTHAQAVEEPPTRQNPEGWTSNGFHVLPCATCVFKEWDKTGADGSTWKQPPCAEQHTYPLLFSPEEGVWQPALYTVQKTGIKPSRTYVSSFAQAKQPMFSVMTTLGLTLNSRGTVKYSVPTFSRGEATDRNEWLAYANQFRSIRGFIRSAPRRFDTEEDGVIDDNVNTGPSVPTAAAPASAATSRSAGPKKSAAPVTAPARVAPEVPSSTDSTDEDELPF
jgi:hypothetical protein